MPKYASFGYKIMPKATEKEKTLTFLEKDVSVISAVNNPRLGPYLDIFRHYPENIMLQPLGTLAGFFRINDLSEESSYIVNFLSSVLKKEYFANPKRPVENSLDAALRKVNLALSEIAKEGNINWLGKINGAVCILEKNVLHFSVCGKAQVLLIRNQVLTEISRDVASEEAEPNPMKTFVNVSSGRLEKEDKIIICDNELFSVFSGMEILKGTNRFPREKFIQFIKTALVNKLDLIGTVIIDVYEKTEKLPELEIEEEKIEPFNAFSRKTFERDKPAIKGLNELLKEEEEGKEYTDEKTGHIYIQEGKEGTKKESALGIFWLSFREKVSDAGFWMKNKLKRSFSSWGRSILRSGSAISTKIKYWREERKQKQLEKKQEETKTKETLLETEKLYPSTEKEVVEKISVFHKLSALKNVVPSFQKAKNLLLSLSRKQKISAAAIIILIFVVPFIFLKIQGVMKMRSASNDSQNAVPDAREIFSQEKNIIFPDSLEKVSDIQSSQEIVILNDRLFAIAPDKITILDSTGEKKESAWPENYGEIKNAIPMKDLNLVLILTSKNEVISFLPNSSQFTENSISVLENSKISGAGTYLTYLYLLDSQNSQIYRYPRATGGFGAKTDWLKDSLGLADTCCLAIDENVYLINGSEIFKLFKGKRQDFNLEQAVNPSKPSQIFTNSDTENIYILDKENGRVIKYSKTGELLSQYFHEEIKNATDLSVDEKNNKVYLSTPTEITSFNLQ